MPAEPLIARFRRSSASLRGVGAAAYLIGWAAALLLVTTVLMVGHWVTLPRPNLDDPRLASALTELRAAPSKRWELTHVLYVDCRCSQRVFAHLLERPTPAAASERVLMVGSDDAWRRQAALRGFEVLETSAEQLGRRFGIESAPLLLISDPGGEVRYAGGYTDRKQGPQYRDVEALEALRRGEPVELLPLFGCGVTRELQAILDPIGAKYGS